MASTLNARFSRRYSGGTVIRADFSGRAQGQGVTVLFGPSGCGKTTVLRCLAGLEMPQAGHIRLGAETWFDSGRGIDLTPQQRGAGFVFQDYALFPHLSVAGNIAYGLPAAGRPGRVSEMLERFDLAAVAHQRPLQLSGGQQQRVALARALAGQPSVLLLDEPFSALDAGLRDRLRGELRDYLSGCDIPVLLVTHDRDEAIALGDELVVMSAGMVRQSGPVLNVFNRPVDAEVARIVQVENLLPGRVLDVTDELATVKVGRARLVAVAPEQLKKDVVVCIRGEEVILQRDDGIASSVRNRLRARVVSLRPGSPLTRVELDGGFPLFAYVTQPACDELGLCPGMELTVLIKAPAIHLVERA
ncbi:MAG: ABC transporter ATP-binding protein [Lysobacterales bacterium]|jgi:molybdate transport system ATP-binding protein